MVPGRPRSRSRCRPGSREGQEALLGDHAVVPAHPVRKEVVDCCRLDRSFSVPVRTDEERATLPKEVSVHPLVYRYYFARTIRAAYPVRRAMVDVVVAAGAGQPQLEVPGRMAVAGVVRPTNGALN